MTSAISSLHPDPSPFSVPDDAIHKATRAWLIWLQGLFRTRPSGHHRWDPNMDQTEIVITDQNPDKIEKSNIRPVIATARGPATWAGTSMGQSIQHDLASPRTTYTDIIGTSMTLSIVAREGLEAQNIAYFIFRMIPVFKSSIMRLGDIHAISSNITLTQENQQGSVVPGSSSPEWKMIQVIIPFYIQDVVTADEKDFYSLMRTVNLHMGLE